MLTLKEIKDLGLNEKSYIVKLSMEDDEATLGTFSGETHNPSELLKMYASSFKSLPLSAKLNVADQIGMKTYERGIHSGLTGLSVYDIFCGFNVIINPGEFYREVRGLIDIDGYDLRSIHEKYKELKGGQDGE